MKSQVFFIVIALVLVALLIPGIATATNVTLGSGHVNTTGEEITVQLVLEEAPNGLAGYSLNLTMDEPRIARITGVNFPSWAAMHSIWGLTEGKEIRFMAVDLLHKAEVSSTEVPLASITIQGLINGSTTVHISRDKFDDDSDDSIPHTLVDGNISVGSWTNSGTAPITAFSGSPLAGNEPLTVAFTDTSANTPTAWSWSFGDGSTNTTQNPTHTFASQGTYAISLIATNAGGSNTTTRAGYITVGAPLLIPDFTGTPISGTAPLNVTFTDTSTGSPTNWNWSFGDGNFSVLRNSSHVYSAAGTYTVSLNATGASGSNTTTRTNYITVTSPAGSGTVPTPLFTGSPLSGTAPLTVTFTDLSTGSPTSRNWSFGDGNFSTAQNPAHAYTSSGAFTVSLTSTNSAGSNSRTEARYITVAARSQNADMTLNGTSIQTSGGKQSVTVNLTNVNGTVTQPDLNSVIVQNPGSGWSRMELVSSIPVTSEAGNLNVSEISQVVMTTNPLVAALNQTTLGTVTAQISIPMNQMPTGVSIEQNIFEGANTSALTSFQLAATNSNLNINEVAYTVEIKNTATLNANLTGAGDPVKLNMSVSHTWVIANGGTERIKIIRSAEDGTKQVLTTRFLFNDAVMNMDYFEADSPNGLSVFGVAAVSSATSSGISSGSSSSSSDSFPSQPKSIEMKTPKGTGPGSLDNPSHEWADPSLTN